MFSCLLPVKPHERTMTMRVYPWHVEQAEGELFAEAVHRYFETAHNSPNCARLAAYIYDIYICTHSWQPLLFFGRGGEGGIRPPYCSFLPRFRCRLTVTRRLDPPPSPPPPLPPPSTIHPLPVKEERKKWPYRGFTNGSPSCLSRVPSLVPKNHQQQFKNSLITVQRTIQDEIFIYRCYNDECWKICIAFTFLKCHKSLLPWWVLHSCKRLLRATFNTSQVSQPLRLVIIEVASIICTSWGKVNLVKRERSGGWGGGDRD